jgi:hypothetical protein
MWEFILPKEQNHYMNTVNSNGLFSVGSIQDGFLLNTNIN